MRRCVFVLTVAVLSASVDAGVGGILIKGALKTWDEVAKIALKASGRATSEEAVTVASKTLKTVAGKYGDDVAEAAMHGGMEVAEQTAKNGVRFASLIPKAGKASPEALRMLALHADDAMKYTAKYGDAVLVLNSKTPGIFSRGVIAVEKSGVKSSANALKAISQLPAEDVPRVVGALEKNPSVAKEFLEGVEKGGKSFVDKIFELNWKQIAAGGLSAAAIIGAIRATSTLAAEGNAINAQTDLAVDTIKRSSEKEKKEFAKDWAGTTNKNRATWTRAATICGIVLSVFAGIALVLYVARKRQDDHTS